MLLTSLQGRVTLDDSDFQAGTTRVVQGMDRMSKGAEELTFTFGGLRQVGADLRRLGAEVTFLVSGPLLALDAMSVKNAADMQAMQLSLASITGSAELAAVEMEHLKEVAKMPGIGFEEAVTGAVRLQAVGFSAAFTERALRSMANAISATAGHKEDLEDVSLAFQKMVSTGHITERYLTEISRRIPQVRQALVDAFGTSTGRVITEQGHTISEVVEVMVNAMEKIKPVGDTARNSFDNLSDAIFQGSARIGQSLLPIVVPAVKSLTDEIYHLTEKFDELPMPMRQTILGLTAFGIALGPVIYGTGQLISLGAGIANIASAYLRWVAMTQQLPQETVAITENTVATAANTTAKGSAAVVVQQLGVAEAEESLELQLAKEAIDANTASRVAAAEAAAAELAAFEANTAAILAEYEAVGMDANVHRLIAAVLDGEVAIREVLAAETLADAEAASAANAALKAEVEGHYAAVTGIEAQVAALEVLEAQAYATALAEKEEADLAAARISAMTPTAAVPAAAGVGGAALGVGVAGGALGGAGMMGMLLNPLMLGMAAIMDVMSAFKGGHPDTLGVDIGIKIVKLLTGEQFDAQDQGAKIAQGFVKEYMAGKYSQLPGDPMHTGLPGPGVEGGADIDKAARTEAMQFQADIDAAKSKGEISGKDDRAQTMAKEILPIINKRRKELLEQLKGYETSGVRDEDTPMEIIKIRMEISKLDLEAARAQQQARDEVRKIQDQHLRQTLAAEDAQATSRRFEAEATIRQVAKDKQDEAAEQLLIPVIRQREKMLRDRAGKLGKTEKDMQDYANLEREYWQDEAEISRIQRSSADERDKNIQKGLQQKKEIEESELRARRTMIESDVTAGGTPVERAQIAMNELVPELRREQGIVRARQSHSAKGSKDYWDAEAEIWKLEEEIKKTERQLQTDTKEAQDKAKREQDQHRKEQEEMASERFKLAEEMIKSNPFVTEREHQRELIPLLRARYRELMMPVPGESELETLRRQADAMKIKEQFGESLTGGKHGWARTLGGGQIPMFNMHQAMQEWQGLDDPRDKRDAGLVKWLHGGTAEDMKKAKEASDDATKHAGGAKIVQVFIDPNASRDKQVETIRQVLDQYVGYNRGPNWR